MSITKDKLSEAEFFFEQLKNSALEYPQFNYYLSAFVSSARSVLWIMRSEFNSIEDWGNWYQSKEPDSEEALFLKKINAIRVRTEKISPITTHFQISFMIPKDSATPELEQELRRLQESGNMLSVAVSDEDNEKVFETEISGKKVSFLGKVEKVYSVIGDFPDDDVIDICARYLGLLQKIVEECLGIFSTQSDLTV